MKNNSGRIEIGNIGLNVSDIEICCPPALHRLTFVADSTEEVNRTRRLLENLGARWSEEDPLCSQVSSSVVLYFEDPDGIPIELYTPDGETSALEGAPTGSAKRTSGIWSGSLTTHKGIKNGRLI